MLVSCGMSDEEKAAAKAEQYKVDVAQATSQCKSFGFNQNTQSFSNCLQLAYNGIVNQRRAEAAERNRQFYAAMSGLKAAGQSLQSQDSSFDSTTSEGGGPINTVNTVGFGRTLNCRPQPHPGQIYCY